METIQCNILSALANGFVLGITRALFGGLKRLRGFTGNVVEFWIFLERLKA